MLQGKTAVITGASRGIGRAIAEQLAANAANVVIAATDEAKLAEVREAMQATGAAVLAKSCDVREPESVQALVDAAQERFGRVDIAVANAGLARDNIFLRMSEEEWAEVLEVNLTGAFRFAKAVARPMRKQKAGSIVFVASLAGLHGNRNQANYAASKGGMIALAKTLAKELMPYNVRVNTVCPGLIDTDMTRAYTEELRELGRQQVPLGRFGTPQEVAHAVHFFAAPQASYITGQVLRVDGGVEI